jgi:hypothetical protein
MIRSMMVALLLLGCSGESDEARREEVFVQYIRAVNANDVSAALSYHTPNPEFLIPGRRPIVGTEAMRALLQWDSVLGSQLRFDAGQWSGDTLTVGAGAERNAWFGGIGLDSIHYAPGTRFVFERDRIRGVYPSSITAKSAEEFEAKVGAFMVWAEANAPEVTELAPGGQFRYDGESARRWLDVLERYGRRMSDAVLDTVGLRDG